MQITPAFRPVVVRVSFEKLVLRGESFQKTAIRLRSRAVGNKRSRGSRIDPERRPCGSLQKGRKIKSFQAGGKSETIDDLGVGREADWNLVEIGDLSVAVHIMVLDI